MHLKRAGLAIFFFCFFFSTISTAQISEDTAIQTLMTWIQSHKYYDLPTRCIKPKSLGYKNAGYTIELFAGNCAGYVPDRLLGRWRVDAHTAEIYVQNETGKYLSPNFTKGKGSSSLVREEHEVIVGGIKERWRLEWIHLPKPYCAPEEGYWEWSTCPCWGFAFGESGELDLVRIRPGASEDRLHLTSFFEETLGEGAVLRRWPVLAGDDDDQSPKPEFAVRVRARPQVSVMKFADYNHDGQATEFVLQVSAGPCGHQQCVLVGIDSCNPHLHVFGTVKHPDRPLILEHPSDWEQLLRSGGDVTVVQVSCGDHGSDAQTEIRLRTDGKGIHATEFVYDCEKNNKLRQPISHKDY